MSENDSNQTLGKVKVYSKVPKKSKLIKKIKEVLKTSGLVALAVSGIICIANYTANVIDETMWLQEMGVPTNVAIHASIDPDYIQPELRNQVEEFDKILEERFPEVKFHDSGNVVLSDEEWTDKDKGNGIEAPSGVYHGIFDAAVFNSNRPGKQAHENIHRRLRHTVIKENGEKEEYNGLQRLSDGKGDKLSEALTTWLENELYGEDTCYFEHKYLDLMFYFIPVEDVVKIAAEGSMEDLGALFSPYFDCDIVDIIDKTPGVDDVFNHGADYVIEGLTSRANLITDAFYKWVNISEASDEEKMEKIQSYREYLSKNFVKSVDYFDRVFADYINTAPSK